MISRLPWPCLRHCEVSDWEISAVLSNRTELVDSSWVIENILYLASERANRAQSSIYRVLNGSKIQNTKYIGCEDMKGDNTDLSPALEDRLPIDSTTVTSFYTDSSKVYMRSDVRWEEEREQWSMKGLCLHAQEGSHVILTTPGGEIKSPLNYDFC